MKPHVLLGLVIALVVGGGAALAPRLLPSSVRARDAEVLAANEAYSKLQQHSSTFDAARRAANVGELEKADLESLVTAATPALEKVTQRLGELMRQRNAAAQKLGIEARPIPALVINASRLKDSLSKVASYEKSNAGRLPTLAAPQTSAGVAALPHAAGLQSFIRAASSFGEAQEARLRMYRALSDARAALAENDSAGSEGRYWSGLDYATPKQELATAIEEIAQRGTAAQAQIAELTQQVDERKTRIRDYAQRTTTLRSELETLQTQGFRLGDERAFSDYSNRMRSLQQQMNDAQRLWVLYEQGGREQAELKGGDSVLDAEIVGGESITPLAILEARLAAAQDTLKRTEIATAALNEETERLTGATSAANQRSSTLTEFQSTARSRAKKSLETALAESAAADKLESDATSQAQKAVSAFGTVAQSLRSAKSAAAELRSKYDPNGKNDRLKKIQSDQSSEQLGIGAKAEAQMLLGQIEVTRAQALDALLATLRIATEAGVAVESGGAVAADPAAMQTALTAARDAAKNALTAAAADYEGAVANQLPAAAKGWAAVARAGALHWLMLVDAESADTHRTAAKAALESAAASLSKHPLHARRLAAFADFLNPPPPPAPKTADSQPASTPSEGAAAESKPSESDDVPDLFGDDEG